MTLTHQQAADRASQLVNQVVNVLHPRPGLELNQGLSLDVNCETATGDSSLVNVSRTYDFSGITVSDNGAIGSQVLSYWQKQGYTITRSDGIGTQQPNINAQTSDGFLLALESGAGGLLDLVASSPCAQPESTTG